MELKKIKITNAGGLEAKYLETKQDKNGMISQKEHTVKCTDEPHPDLTNALQALELYVRWDESLDEEADITITGVSFFSQETVVILTHTKEIKSGVSVRNSGRIDLEADGRPVEVDHMVKRLKKLKSEVMDYLYNNKRAQLSIFSEEAQAVA